MLRSLTPCLAGLLLAALAPTAPAQALAPEPAVVEFGDVFEGEAPRTTVEFANKGEADLKIQQVRTSCGCTVATVAGPDGVEIAARSAVPDQPILTLKPGDTMKVGVELNTANQHGAVEKRVEVYFMDPGLQPIQVPVRARVSKAFAITPEQVNLGMVGKRGLLERELTIQAQAIGDWSIDGFESGLEGRPLPAGLRFEILDKEGQTRRIKLVSDGPRPVGPITSKVRIKITHERVKSIEFYLYGQVQSDIVFNSGNANFPETISFDQMEPGSKVTRTLTITNQDAETPYTITSVDVQAPKPEFFKTEIRTIEEGKKYEIDVTADAAIAENFFRGNLVVRATHPDVPSRVVPFHGWVRKPPAPEAPAAATPKPDGG
jgi:Protein of unknown function (DUF1573)